MAFALTIFDYDGVLVDSLGQVISAGTEFCRSISHDRVPTRETIGAVENMIYPEIARAVGLTPEQSEKFALHLFDRFQAAGSSIVLFPGIEMLLHRMAPRSMAIVSGNSREVVSEKLAAYHLGDAVPCILGALEPGDKADKIGRVCRQFGVDTTQACMVGDAVSDLRAAKRAGVQSIAVTWGWQSRDLLLGSAPDFIVDSVAELAVLLDSECPQADTVR